MSEADNKPRKRKALARTEKKQEKQEQKSISGRGTNFPPEEVFNTSAW